MVPTARTLSQSTSIPPGWVTARTTLMISACAFPACSGDWSAAMLSALDRMRDPLGGILYRAGLALSLMLQALNLPLIPGRQACHGAGPAILADPAQRSHRDRGHGHPLVEAAASQRVTDHAQRDQPQGHPVATDRGPRPRRRPAAARCRDGGRRFTGSLPRSCHFASRPESPAYPASLSRRGLARHHPARVTLSLLRQGP